MRLFLRRRPSAQTFESYLSLLLFQVLRVRKYFDGFGDDCIARHGLNLDLVSSELGCTTDESTDLKIGGVVLLKRELELKQRAWLLRGRGDFELPKRRKAIPHAHQSVAVQVRHFLVRVAPEQGRFDV